MNSITNLTPQQLRRAADLREKIVSLEKELNQLLGSPAEISVGVAAKRKRRLSAKGIANIRAGARKRWGNLQDTNGPVQRTRKRKRRMSDAGRARLSAIAKARWRKARAQGKSSL